MSNDASPRHVVLGTGPLARSTVESLIAGGKDVSLVSRSGAMKSTPSQATVVAADLLDRAAAGRACTGAEAIYFCAQPPYHQWPQFFPALQAAAIDVAADVGAKLIVAENLYSYGETAEVLKETTPVRPTSVKGRVRAEMHDTLMQAHAAGRIKTAVARGSSFFGPWVDASSVGSRPLRALLRGKPVEVIGNPDMPHTVTYVRDFGAALALLGSDPRGIGEVWHVPNAPAVTTRRFFEIAGLVAEKPVRLRKLGLFQLRIAGLFMPAAKELIEMIYEFEKPYLVDHSKFTATFGDVSTPLEAAIAQTLDWLRNGG